IQLITSRPALTAYNLTLVSSYHRPLTPRDLHSFPTRRSSDLRADQPRQLHRRGARDGPRARERAAADERAEEPQREAGADGDVADRKSTRLNSSHLGISYAVFCLKKKKKAKIITDVTTRLDLV